MRFPVHSPCPLPGGIAGFVGGIARTLSREGELQGLFCMGGMARTLLHVGKLQGLHYRGIVVDPWGKQVEHGQVELKHVKGH